MKTYRVMLVEQQADGSFEGPEALREIMEFEMDTTGKNLFSIMREVEADCDGSFALDILNDAVNHLRADAVNWPVDVYNDTHNLLTACAIAIG